MKEQSVLIDVSQKSNNVNELNTFLKQGWKVKSTTAFIPANEAPSNYNCSFMLVIIEKE